MTISQDRKPDAARIKWIIIGGLTGLAVTAMVFFGPVGEWIGRSTAFLMDKEGARNYILAQPHAALYFIGLQALQVIFSPIPGELSGLLGGFIFGWVPGFFYSTLGLTLGSLAAVSIGRALERVFLEKIIPARILDEFGARVDRYGLVTVFILFLIPGAPKDYLSYLFGLSRIPILHFVVVSALARIPGTLVLSLQGAKVFQGDWVFIIALTLAALIVLVPLLFFKDRILSWFGITDRPYGAP